MRSRAPSSLRVRSRLPRQKKKVVKKLRREIKRLASLALIKWKDTTNETFCQCSFCFDSVKRTGGMDCNSCLCPKILCSDGASSGLISIFPKNDTTIKETISSKKIYFKTYRLMLYALNKLARDGTISIDTKMEIKKLIKKGE